MKAAPGRGVAEMTKKETRHHEWLSRITGYKASGLTMAKWCEENGVTLEQFKYWNRKLKKVSDTSPPFPAPRWVPLTVEGSSPAASVASLVVRIGQASIELQADYDALLLRKIVNALEAPC
jgi:hypothetical protein